MSLKSKNWHLKTDNTEYLVLKAEFIILFWIAKIILMAEIINYFMN